MALQDKYKPLTDAATAAGVTGAYSTTITVATCTLRLRQQI